MQFLRGNLLQPGTIKPIVGAQKHYPASCHVRKGLVPRIIDTAIRFALPIVNHIIIFQNYINGTVRRSAIDNKPFDIPVGLLSN